MEDDDTLLSPEEAQRELEELEAALNEDAAEEPAPHEAEHDAHQDPDHEHDLVHTEHLSVSTFFDSWALFGDAAMAGAFSGGLLGVLGVYIVLRRMIFLSAGLSQAASLGIVMTFVLHGVWGWGWLHPLAGAAVAVASTLLLLSSSRMTRQFRERSLGVVYLMGSAGTLILGTRIPQEMHDVNTVLFGSAVMVVPREFWWITATTGLLLAIHIVCWRGFTAVTFDAQDARVRKMPVRGLEVVLGLTIAAAVALSTTILGALPTFAFSVLPAMAALGLMANVQRALVCAGVLGAGIGFGGYLLAFVYELPVGATQATLGGLVVVIAGLLQMIRSRM